MSSNWSRDPLWCRFLIYRRRPGLCVWRQLLVFFVVRPRILFRRNLRLFISAKVL
jgi:hypothetical protein